MKTFVGLLFGILFSITHSQAAELPAYPPNAGLKDALQYTFNEVLSFATANNGLAQLIGFTNKEEALTAKAGLSLRGWKFDCTRIREFKPDTDWKSTVASRSFVVQSITNKNDEIRATTEVLFNENKWVTGAFGADKNLFNILALLIQNSGKVYDFDKMGILSISNDLPVTAFFSADFFAYYDDSQNEWMISQLHPSTLPGMEYGKFLPAREWMNLLSKQANRFCK